MTNATLDAAPAKVQKNQKIYDWAELEAAIERVDRLPKQTALSTAVFELAVHSGMSAKYLAQLDERLLAFAKRDCIELVYGHTSPGAGIESLLLTRSVRVFPAQGGRTTYEISRQVNGYFANRHLPMRARDRGTRSRFRDVAWYCGQSGIYRPGMGPIYTDVGPAMTNLSHAELTQRIADAGFLPENWQSRASAFADKLRDSVAPFGDAVLRYRTYGLEDPPEFGCRPAFAISTFLTGFDIVVRSHYGLVISIKHPARLVNSNWEHLPELVVAVCGPRLGEQDADDVTYVAGFTHAGTLTPVRLNGPMTPSVCQDYSVFRKPGLVYDLARNWCGDNIHIPA